MKSKIGKNGSVLLAKLVYVFFAVAAEQVQENRVEE
jgi:hypothetical protein